VTKQSEHLSSAQIENYGIRTSGAGPETAQRDERQRPDHQGSGDPRVIDQRVTDQSASDQRVEAHLADCASCRNRLLDFHRSLFASSTYPPEPDRPKAADLKNDPKNGPPEHDASLSGHSPSGYSASGHLPSGQRPADSSLEGTKPTDSALADSKFANPKYPVQAQVRTAATPECPSDDALRELAAGLTSDDAAPALTRHAATCDHCGPLLRTYTEIFSDDFGPEEQAALANLQSSSASWQKNTARQMLQAAATIATGAAGAAEASAAETGGSHATATVKPGKKPSAGRPASSASDRKPFFWKWALVPAIAAVVALAAITFPVYLARRDSPEKVEVLLAEAFTKQRTIEMRWPGAKWAPVRVRQAPTSILHTPVELLDAENALEKQHADSSSSDSWLQMSSRADMLSWRPQPAIDKLTKLINAHPGSTALQSDLAMAYFQRGEVTNNLADYRQSLAYLNDLLRRQPLDHVALYNRAVVIERLGPVPDAIRAWSDYLHDEDEPHWALDARDHLSKLQMQK
jgi:tetratricopeptide (TPR) repeat protein